MISFLLYFILYFIFFVFFYFLFCFFFFFSSRRRHTRCLSDWSSDVCSSDLPARASWRDSGDCSTTHVPAEVVASERDIRSEERRVGKEWRSRWGAER